MKIQGRYLIVPLLAVLTCLPAVPSGTALGQDATWVIIRATAPPGRPGRVPARVTVSKSRVRVGEWLMVSLAPPAGVNRPLFRVSFGDGREEVTRNRQIDHKYGRVGHYDIYASVESEAPPPPPPVPRVVLSVAPNTTPVEKPVTFNAQLSSSYPGIKYRFVFGDNDQTAWQDQPLTTHEYAQANTYRAYVEIGADDNGSFKPLGGSARETVRVNAQPQPRDSVNLNANPTTVAVGRRVTFNARAISRDLNISYRFVFGDGSATDWQTSSQALYDYASPNSYQAYVQIRSSSITFGRPVISSARQPIQVIAPQRRLAVDLTVDPATANTETLVTLTARVNSRDTNIRYRFFYGDGSASEWQVGRRSSRRYPVANTYFAYVEAGLLNNNLAINVEATSKTKQVAVTPIAPPTPSPTPTPTPGSSPTSSPGSSPTSSPGSSPSSSPGSSPTSPGPPRSITDSSPPPADGDPPARSWWKYLLVALLIAFVGYRTYGLLFAPRPTFRPVPDAGGSGVDEVTNPLAINSQILLKPGIADGLYRVNTDEPNLVRSIRREND
ncbi:MAG: PKD domain-containing protein [Pyrinomonadaceae bacterium]|nr:PKD domain-containing protein [Pyrinomonadaceae bacterium]